MDPKEILVVIPHSGLLIPGEIPIDSLSDDFQGLVRNIDWYTNWLYDFNDILDSSCLVFPYCSLLLEANRRPDEIESSVPLKDVFGEPVYQVGREPGIQLRESLSEKYLKEFHRQVEAEIKQGKAFLLDAHSTVPARGVKSDQIELMNYQTSLPENTRTYFSPDIFIEVYAEELGKRLPGIRVTVNQSQYHTVYGHICGEYSTAAMSGTGSRIPAILQETSQHLYMNPDRTPDIKAVETLRRAFALSLQAMMQRVFPDKGGRRD